MVNSDTDHFFQSLFHRYIKGLEDLMRGIDFSFDNGYGFYWNCYETSLRHGGSYIDSSGWVNWKNYNKPKKGIQNISNMW